MAQLYYEPSIIFQSREGLATPLVGGQITDDWSVSQHKKKADGSNPQNKLR